MGLSWQLGKTHKLILLRETFLAHLGGVLVLHRNVSQILAISDFFKQRNYQKNLVIKEENYKYITLSQTSCLNLDKFGIGNCISDCQSAPFASLDLIFTSSTSVSAHIFLFKLIIDFRLECFQAGGWGVLEKHANKHFYQQNQFVILPLVGPRLG